MTTKNVYETPTHSDLYSKFRPSPPEPLINFIITYCKSNSSGGLKHAVDIGCGTGQSTFVLSPHFDKVTGYDLSDFQIESAIKNRSAPNIEYKVQDCLNLPLPGGSVQLVTSSEAIHWFDLEKLYEEVKRVLVPSGVIAAYGYWFPLPQGQNLERTKKIEKTINDDFIEHVRADFWEKQRLMLSNFYKDLFFPFEDVQRFDMVHKTESSLTDFIGYLSSWSPYQKLFNIDAKKAKEILQNLEKELIENLELKDKDEVFPLHINFFLVIGHS